MMDEGMPVMWNAGMRMVNVFTWAYVGYLSIGCVRFSIFISRFEAVNLKNVRSSGQNSEFFLGEVVAGRWCSARRHLPCHRRNDVGDSQTRLPKLHASRQQQTLHFRTFIPKNLAITRRFSASTNKKFIRVQDASQTQIRWFVRRLWRQSRALGKLAGTLSSYQIHINQ